MSLNFKVKISTVLSFFCNDPIFYRYYVLFLWSIVLDTMSDLLHPHESLNRLRRRLRPILVLLGFWTTLFSFNSLKSFSVILVSLVKF